MQLTININNPAEISLAIQALGKLLPSDTLAGAQPQPQVGENSGSVSTVTPFSTGAGTVTGAGAVGVSAADQPAPALVKKVKARKEPVVVEAAPEEANPTFEDVPELPEATPEAQAPRGDLSLDDARDALKACTAKHGMDAGIALLKKFSAARISELAPSDYAAFIKEAQS